MKKSSASAGSQSKPDSRSDTRSEVRTAGKAGILKELPQIDEILRGADVVQAGAGIAAESLATIVRETIGDMRQGVLSGRMTADDLRERLRRLPDEVRGRIAGLSESSLVATVNATGIIVHTNLGRAPLAPGALERVAAVGAGYSTLEYDLGKGARGSRGDHLQRIATRLFPGKGIHAVNNTASALLLVLNTLADGREVLISRGELIEIGGSFRIPDIMSLSGAILREVGTTNRTRTADFEKAMSPATGLILKVHTSNYRIVGFTAEASLPDLVRLGRERGIPVAVDQGSGNLIDVAPYGIPDEPAVGSIIDAGCDLVLFSGDKMLGGPQAGLIVGDTALVKRCRENHLTRALRLDKMTLAALEWTLQRYAIGREREDIPVVRMITEPLDSVARRARGLAARIRRATGDFFAIELIDGESMIGGGAAPLTDIPTRLVALTSKRLSADAIEARLRRANPPVIARVKDGKLLLDPRTLLKGQERDVVAALNFGDR